MHARIHSADAWSHVAVHAAQELLKLLGSRDLALLSPRAHRSEAENSINTYSGDPR